MQSEERATNAGDGGEERAGNGKGVKGALPTNVSTPA